MRGIDRERESEREGERVSERKRQRERVSGMSDDWWGLIKSNNNIIICTCMLYNNLNYEITHYYK